jgi:hypothetical protein
MFMEEAYNKTTRMPIYSVGTKESSLVGLWILSRERMIISKDIMRVPRLLQLGQTR